MTERNHAREAERLPEAAVRRLLQRASELEAERSAETSIAELREAAREAGITEGAFDEALAEIRGTRPSAAVRVPARWWHLAILWPAALGVAAVLSILVLRLLLIAS